MDSGGAGMLLEMVLWGWGAHIMDGFHQFLNLGLPQKIVPKLTGHNDLSIHNLQLSIYFPKGFYAQNKVTRYDGVENLEVPRTMEISRLIPGQRRKE